MAKLNFLIFFFILWKQLPCGQCSGAGARSGDMTEKFTLLVGPKSHLFSQCIEHVSAIEGSLYSISISGDEDYVRFVPKKTTEMSWTDVNLSPESNIIHCAIEALKVGAYMFKYDGSCKVSMHKAYDRNDEQGCDDTAGEVVYITTRELDSTDGFVVPVQESDGCFVSTPEGMTFGDDDNRLVEEAVLPPRDNCCMQADDGYCLVADCADRTVSYCEGKTRCEARGYRMVSKSLFQNMSRIVHWSELGSRFGYFWINVRRGEDDVWRWQPDMTEVEEIPVDENSSPENYCGALYYSGRGKVLLPAPCTKNQMKCTLCYDPNTSLPACS